MEFKDYYSILGVPRNADQKAIAAAYRKLARKHHPDVNRQDPTAEEKFKAVNEAHQALSDPEKRARYDQVLDLRQRGGASWEEILRGAPGGRQTAPGGWTFTVEGEDAEGLGFSDFFRQIFGQAAGGPPRTQAREDLAGEVEISLEEAFRGTVRTVRVGSRSVEVTIPKGIESGRRLRLRGQGGARGGDLYLEVRVAPHRLFERKGDDLHVEVPVTVSEATLGAEIQVPTLEGAVAMTLPAGTQSGQQLRLRDQGMPRLGGSGRGDEFVHVTIAVPRRLSARERELFEELRRLRPENPREKMGLK